jgi:hypothetical protein
MEIDEAKFQRNWRTTLAVCLAYVAILGLVFIVAVYHVAPVVPDKARQGSSAIGSVSQEARGP